MIKLTKTLILISLINLAGCQSTNSLSLVSNQSIFGMEIKYLVPISQNQSNNMIAGLKIQEYYSSQSDVQDQLTVRNIDQNTFAVHKTIQNSYSGASKIVHVDHATIQKGEFTEITLKPTHIEHIQMREETPNSFPELDIVETLSSSQFEFKFELNSANSPTIVQNKLKNTLTTDFYKPNSYNLEVFGINGFIIAEPKPDNAGSILVVKATLNTSANDNNVIDVTKLLDSLKRELKASIS